jgi:hypothetical protein
MYLIQELENGGTNFNRTSKYFKEVAALTVSKIALIVLPLRYRK